MLSGLARGQEEVIPQLPRTLTDRPAPAGIPADSPAPDADERVLPINLATALRLAGSRPIDVELAGERIRRAAAQLSQARALWLPSIPLGGDYNRHDGPIQDANGGVLKRAAAAPVLDSAAASAVPRSCPSMKPCSARLLPGNHCSASGRPACGCQRCDGGRHRRLLQCRTGPRRVAGRWHPPCKPKSYCTVWSISLLA